MLPYLEIQSLIPYLSYDSAKDAELTEAFNDCETEVRILEDRRQAKQHELDIVTANKDRNAFKQTALERAGQWISDSSSEAKLAAEIALLDRSIKQKKEALGILIFDHLDKGGSGMLGTLNKLSQSGRDINKCVTDAKRDVDAYKATKDRKMRELYNVPS